MKFLLSFVTFLLCCGILAFGGYQTVAQSDFEGIGAAFEEAITSNPLLPQKPVNPDNPTCEEHVDKDGDYVCDNCYEVVGFPENPDDPDEPTSKPTTPTTPNNPTTKPTTPSTPSTTTKPTTPTTITRPTTSGTKPTTIPRPTTSTTTRPGSTNNSEPNPPVDEPCLEHVDNNIDNICDNCGTDLGQLNCTEHMDRDNDYYCDNCGAELERPCVDHVDANVDYFCDYCATELERPCVDHIDGDGNYYCDYCATILEHEHIDEDKSRKCDICNEPIAITEEEMEEDIRNSAENITEENAPIVNKTLSDSIGSFIDEILGPDWDIPAPEHNCESICATCGKCLDKRCAEDACAEKCQGHGVTPGPEHECESVCEECGKCLDSDCNESACTSKCRGHEPDDSDYNAPFIPEENLPEDDEDDDEPVKYDYKAMIKEATTIYTNNFVQETLAMRRSTEGKSEYEKLAIEAKFYSDEAAGKQAFMNLILLSTSTTGALSEQEVINSVSNIMRSRSCMKTVGEMTETLYPLVERIQSATGGFTDETNETIKNNIQDALSLYMSSADVNAEYAQNYHDLANMLNITLD